MAIPHPDRPATEAGPVSPLRHSMAWGAEPPPVAAARGAVRAVLARAGHAPDGRTCQDAQLVVSELVTNAFRHAPGPGGLELEVPVGGGVLRITVSDTSPAPLRPQPTGTNRVGGHGLALVALLCSELRTAVRDPGPGKRVSADFPLPLP
ncbi:ATP-binding protein [Streptomyces sp. NPDC001941]|uniref:ATP-binding protein n=1 Tax=Streptomyces sp. NPDC001941 TaxID=3154659 RepID=UPI003333FD09